MEVSVRDLESQLSAYLRRVAEGEALVVTLHGKEVARLLPPRSASAEAELIARFRNLPWVSPGNGEKTPLPKPLVTIKKDEKALADIVVEQRE